ncbi:uncharacterized protein LOC125725417 isoform X2 [Brienomyrus brachyistius]|uniref:uncharacterized protein LOC125725417 isoform X2 n=1 Tax=Brienomyrus brachyistius TaxID=42636 RepID=UPI0020B440EC|nr:uncharacterized protein LOC125725417 isoform X2 [Brienomyrus brachyistius]
MEDLDITENSYLEYNCAPSFSKRSKLLAPEKYLECENTIADFPLPSFHGLPLECNDQHLLFQNTLQDETSEEQYLMQKSIKYPGCEFGTVEAAEFINMNSTEINKVSDMSLYVVNNNANMCQELESKKQTFLRDIDVPFGRDTEDTSEIVNNGAGRKNETFTVGDFEMGLLEPDYIVTLDEVEPVRRMNKLSKSGCDNKTSDRAFENVILNAAIPSLDKSFSGSQRAKDDRKHDVHQYNRTEKYPMVSTLFSDHIRSLPSLIQNESVSKMEEHGLEYKGNGARLKADKKDVVEIKLEAKAEVNHHNVHPERTAAETSYHINNPATIDAGLRNNLESKESANSVDLHYVVRAPWDDAFCTATESLYECTEQAPGKDSWSESQIPDDAVNVANLTEFLIYSETGLLVHNKPVASGSTVVLMEHRFKKTQETTYLDKHILSDMVKIKTNKVLVSGISTKDKLDSFPFVERCVLKNRQLLLSTHRNITIDKHQEGELLAAATANDAVVPKWDSRQGNEQENSLNNNAQLPVPFSSDLVPTIFDSHLVPKTSVESSPLLNKSTVRECTIMLQSRSEVAQPSQEVIQNHTKPLVDLHKTNTVAENECVIFQDGSTLCSISNKGSTESVYYEKSLNNDIFDIRSGNQVVGQDRTEPLEGKMFISKSDDNITPTFEAKENFDLVLKELFLEKHTDTYILLRLKPRKTLPIKGPEEQASEQQTEPMLRNAVEEKKESTDKELNSCNMTAFRGQKETTPDRHGCEYEQEVPLECGHLTTELENSMYSTVKRCKEVLDERNKLTPAFISLASFNGQNQMLPGQYRRLEPLKTCSRPIRVGLSKRAKPKQLHSYLK